MTLDSILADAFARLSAAPADRACAFRTPALATTAHDGAPRLRTVVLRAFDPGAPSLTVHSDARAAKVAELKVDSRAALLFWDAARGLQLRISCAATMHADDAVARAAWAALPEGSRRAYRVAQASGTAISAPGQASYTLDDASAFGFFVVISLTAETLDWLHVNGPAQTRALFRFRPATAAWIVP